MTTTPFSTTDDISANINTRKMRANTWLTYTLDKNCEWVKDLLLELNENENDLTDEEKLANSHINLNLKLKKANKGSIGDYVLSEVEIETEFNTLCVKSGTSMKDQIQFTVKMCFLPEHLSTEEAYKDQTEFFTDGEIYELYYLNKNSEAPLKDAIHEQLFLNLDLYPTLAE